MTTKYSELLVLSYNICYQAMTNSPHGSAAALGAKCVYTNEHGKLTVCAEHMAQMIDEIPKSLQFTNFDFVGLQEANRWDLLQSQASQTLNKMAVVDCSVTSNGVTMHMASFYDQTKYQLTNHYNGSLRSQRPFQILICKDINNSSGIIFINVHAPQSYDKFEDIEAELNVGIQSLNLTSNEKQYRIIATGDFNNTDWDWQKKDLKRKSWVPFQQVAILTPIQIDNVIFSCSQDDGDWLVDTPECKNNPIGKISCLKSALRGGDYIFDSKNAATIKVPPLYDPRVLQSDHLPVIAILK